MQCVRVDITRLNAETSKPPPPTPAEMESEAEDYKRPTVAEAKKLYDKPVEESPVLPRKAARRSRAAPPSKQQSPTSGTLPPFNTPYGTPTMPRRQVAAPPVAKDLESPRLLPFQIHCNEARLDYIW